MIWTLPLYEGRSLTEVRWLWALCFSLLDQDAYDGAPD